MSRILRKADAWAVGHLMHLFLIRAPQLDRL